MKRASNVKQHPHAVDLSEADMQLSLLDFGGKFTFQLFDDSPKKNPKLARILHGTLDEVTPALVRANQAGCGVFVCINETDLKGRSAANVKRVRSLFLDLDGAPIAPVFKWRKPNMVVESSPGKYHCYFFVDDAIASDLDGFRERQLKLAKRFDGDPSMADLPRVLRLAGFYHKKGEPFRSRIIGGQS
jgi:putative DNA primase/helicase